MRWARMEVLMSGRTTAALRVFTMRRKRLVRKGSKVPAVLLHFVTHADVSTNENPDLSADQNQSARFSQDLIRSTVE